MGKDKNIDLLSFNDFFAKYHQRLIRFALSYIDDISVAEDIVMESLTAIWEKRDILTPSSARPYALMTVRNKCLNHLRHLEIRLKASKDIHSHSHKALSTRIATLEACNPEELFSEEIQRLVEKSMDNMAPKTKEIFVRSRMQGMSHKKIAEDMGITTKSVEFEISKAMSILRRFLKDYAYALFIFMTFN